MTPRNLSNKMVLEYVDAGNNNKKSRYTFSKITESTSNARLQALAGYIAALRTMTYTNLYKIVDTELVA